jgi:hypothetical protein
MQFAEAFERRWDVPPSASAAGPAYDGTNMLIQIAKNALEEHSELAAETIYTRARENLQTGEWSFTDGIVMASYRYTPETLSDPVVGRGYYISPCAAVLRWRRQDHLPAGVGRAQTGRRGLAALGPRVVLGPATLGLRAVTKS